VIDQLPEAVVEIPLGFTAAAAAGIGWAIGNLHLELSAEPDRLLAPDEPAVRQSAGAARGALSRPRQFSVRGVLARGPRANHELGPSHRHRGDHRGGSPWRLSAG
jgi:urease accessory protein